MLAESSSIRAEANALYSSGDYENALARYEDAMSSCPNYLHYERAVIQSNMAACHLQVEQWKEAIKIATNALDGLGELDKTDPDLCNSTGNPTASSSRDQETGKPSATDADDADEEIISSGASRAAPAPAPSQPDKSPVEKTRADIQRIRTKALLRRARARSEAGGWQNLAGAEEDYKALSTMPGLGAADLRTVQRQLKALPPRTKAAQEKEMSEMWGKLKSLGDGILRPFGLSTDNFQMVKDEKTGGYSMNFASGGGSSKSS
ncbi:Tetratricopeptide-like helical [Metarhizium album ARSEF 1941]|uniref:Tetratricopeptide-like helical n=1 Tax=Metarhizium album (strain ARSEF 1941) TaxID=1081103 RepID=A0A0B2WTF1_METAS|nr:Tetratricopeptide-like helical [Metarhizium album ARSEF 1941]KHN99346.1 Tetratricopeptide-like helical [Metarhizium album ARSEF 1941]